LNNIKRFLFVTGSDSVLCDVPIEVLYTASNEIHAWRLRRLLAGLSQPRPWFDPRSVHMTYFAGKLALDHVFLGALRFSPVSIIPPLPHTHLHLHVVSTRRANVRKPGKLQIKHLP